MCNYAIGDHNQDGYVPSDVGIGGGDYIETDYCLNCGQMQGAWPLPPSEIETGDDEEQD